MYHYEFLSHTADIRMFVEASTLEELYEGALQGMNAILDTKSESKRHDADQVYPLQLSSLDQTTLLIDFLSDVLTAGYEMRVVYNTLEIHLLNDKTIEAELRGYHVERFDEDIKAVTYHEAEVKQNNNSNWETVVIFDI